VMPYDNLIVDMNHLASRVRHVFSLSHNGEDVSVTYGVIKNIESLLKRFHPKSVIFCQDGGYPAHRVLAVPTYKANREHGDELEYADYIRQLNVLKEAFGFMGIVCIRKIGAEADDICYQASRILAGKSLVISGDHDLLQCINANTDVYVPSKDLVITVSNFQEVMGTPLSSYVDYCALIGDSADNISGVYGIGEKTATKLFEAFKDLSGIYNAANGHSPVGDIREKTKEAILTFGWDRLVKNVFTMALYADRCGSRQAIVNEITNYRPVSKQAVKKWLLANAFVSLLELPNALATLSAPQIKADIFRCPVVCGRRSPV
jgi:5'-3' exonuclease